MRRVCGCLPVSFVVAIALVLSAGPAHAIWPHDTFTGNVPLCTASNTQSYPVIATDGAGGAIVVWIDYRSGSHYDLYAQRVTAAGAVAWTTTGVAICTATGDQTSPALVADGAGGAIISWHDYRPGATADIYAQRINASGTVQWAANGVALCTSTGTQAAPAIVGDGVGGAIVAWYDYRSGSNYDIYAQRINASGAVQWTANGVPLCTATGNQSGPALATDGAGGAIVTWEDERSGTSDIYAQRFNASGTVQWAANGIALCTATGDQAIAAIVADGAGGAIVAWEDGRAGYDVYAQRINAAGAVQWTANGVAVGAATGYQYAPTLASDGVGGAIVAFEDARSGVSDVYVQRVTSSGTVQWAADGVAVCVEDGTQSYPKPVSDGTGGAIISWHDYRSGATADIYAQRVTATGATQWAANGVALCTASGSQYSPDIVADGTGGAIVTWYDVRSGVSNDIYAQRVDRFGYLGAEPSIVSVRDVANDQGGFVKVAWTPSWLDGAADANLSAYDVYRSAPASAPAADVRVRADFSGAAVPGERAVVRYPVGGQVFYWEYLGSASATHFPSGYSFVAATTSDSIAGSNPYTPFLVVGRNSSGSKYWPSSPDSGYSVDNLPPGAVSPFSGTYAGGAAVLHWGVASDADFASYRLYRGATSSFVPGPSNLVVDKPDTGYVDVVGSLNYYKIASVDAHGNVGPYATVLPTGLVGIEQSHTPARLALVAQARRDGSSDLRWTLPHGGDARLTVHAATGRRVRDLESGAHAPGAYITRWDGRDARGVPVARGVYLVRLAAGGQVVDARVLRLP